MAPNNRGIKITTFRLDAAIHRRLNNYARNTRRSLNASANTLLEKSLTEWEATQ